MEFAEVVADKKIPLILLVDTSGSMNAVGRLNAVNMAIREMLDGLRAVRNEEGSDITLTVITYNNDVHVVMEDQPVDKVIFNDLRADGVTNAHLAIKKLSDFFDSYKAKKSVPIVFLVSDGEATIPDLYSRAIVDFNATPWGKGSRVKRFGFTFDPSSVHELIEFAGAEAVYTTIDPAIMAKLLVRVSVSASLSASQGGSSGSMAASIAAGLPQALAVTNAALAADPAAQNDPSDDAW